MEGGVLFDVLIQNRRFDEDTARFYFRQVLHAVRACRSQGVSLQRCSIKPENFLFADVAHKHLKLSAKASKRVVTSKAPHVTSTCSPYYAAPEELSEMDTLATRDPASDMWASGVLLYTIVEGWFPFDAQTESVCEEKVKKGHYARMRYANEDCRDLVAKLLVTDPTKRLTMEEVLRHPWVTKGEAECEADDDRGNKAGARRHSLQRVKMIQEINLPSVNLRSAVEDSQSAFTLIPTLMEQVATSMSEDPTKLIGNEKPYFTFHGSVEAALHCTLVVCSQRMWNVKRKEGTNQLRGFIISSGGLFTYVIGITATLSDTTTIMSVRRRRGPTDEFQKFKAELVAAIREENKPVSWSWELHHQCRDATRLAVCWMHCGMVYECSKTHSKQPLPAEVAGEICSWLRVPYVIRDEM